MIHMKASPPSKPFTRSDGEASAAAWILLLVILLGVGAALLWAVKIDLAKQAAMDASGGSVTHTHSGYDVETLVHDGHFLIVHERGGIIHHPDCECDR